MSYEERAASALLLALADCAADHFLNVRGLLDSVGAQGDEQGLISAADTARALVHLHVVHGFAGEAGMRDFLRVVDPHADGMLDPLELEKAVEFARECQHEPRAPDAGVDGEQAEASPRAGHTAGSRAEVPLGEEARRLCAKARSTVAFGPAAFTETLLRLAFQYMHREGLGVKATASGGVKGLWLIAYLHCRFDALCRACLAPAVPGREGAAEPLGDAPGSGAPGAASRRPQASTRPATRGTETLRAAPRLSWAGTRPPSPVEAAAAQPRVEAAGWRPAAAQLSRVPGAATAAGGQATAGRGATHKGLGGLAPQLCLAVPVLPPVDTARSSAKYSTLRARLIQAQPRLFDRDGGGDSSEEEGPPSAGGSLRHLAGTACETCGRLRGRSGLGTVFCHVCSGVDCNPLCNSVLHPIFARKRHREEPPQNGEERAEPVAWAMPGAAPSESP